MRTQLFRISAEKTEENSLILTSPHKTEDDNIRNSHKSKSYLEIVWILHLRNEAGNGNLANEGVADIEKCIHA